MRFSGQLYAALACLVLLLLAACGQRAAESLTAAIEAGDLQRVAELLDDDPTLVNRVDRIDRYREQSTTITGDARDYIASRPLWKAAEQGHQEIARLLVARGADPNGLGGNRSTPLHAAAVNADMEMVKLLLDSGADPNGAEGQNATPFHGAAGVAFGKGLPVMDLLLDLDVDPTTVNRAGLSPLQNAVSAFNTEPLKKLLTLGADVNWVEENGLTALHFASLNGYLRSVVILCGEGLLEHEPAKQGATPISLARQWEYPHVENFLTSSTGCSEVRRQALRLTDLDARYEFTVAIAECLDGKARRCTNAGVMTPKVESEPRVLAMDLYARGCELGSAVSCSNQGIGFRDGWLGEPDPDRARELFFQACEAGHEPACKRHSQL